MAEEPTTGELARRIDEQSRRMDAGFRDVNARLSDLPTEKTLLALLAARDAEMKAMRDDIDELKVEGKESRRRADEAKRFGWQIAIAGGTFMLGVIVFLFQVMQSGGTA